MATFDDTVTFRGAVNLQGPINLPASAVGDYESDASDPLGPTKTKHVLQQLFGDLAAVTAASGADIVHVAKGAGTVALVETTCTDAAVGAAVVTVDVKKNGTTILSATYNLTSATAAYAKVQGTISSASYAAGDVFTVHHTATAGGGTLPKGVKTRVVFVEGY